MSVISEPISWFDGVIGGVSLPTVPRPRKTWYFAKGRELSSDWTFTRASGDTYFNAAGTLQTIGSNVPAFPYRYVNGVWRPDGISLPGETTNLALQSSNFATTWVATRGAVDVNATVAPDGTTTADRLKDDSSGGTNSVLFGLTVSGLTAAVKHTAGGFFKADQTSWVALIFTNFTSVANNTGVWFDLANGVVGTVNAGFTASIRSVGNGWFQCTATFTADAADTSGIFRVYLSEADGGTGVGLDGTTSIFAWGVQFEAKPYPTSYVPTTTATASRAAISMTRPISALPGTVLIRGRTPPAITTAAAGCGLVSYDDGSSNNQFRLLWTTAGEMQVTVRSGGSAQASINLGALAADTEFAVATRLATNNVGASMSGGAVGTDTNAAMPVAPTTCRLGQRHDAVYWDGTVQTLIEWPDHLNNNELQAVSGVLAA